ncbi:MAG: hypothetical protein GY782_08375 [Gammaproteobacteria bacterium]|nr:hypothetical protein [Gammaproteobacteria bacterium]
MNRKLEALQMLEKEYDKECAELGYPQHFNPDEALYHAIEELRHALGVHSSDIDLIELV